MNGARMAAWHVVLATGVAMSCGSALAGEVTVIGTGGVSPWAPVYGDAGSPSHIAPPGDVRKPPNPNVVIPEDPFNSSWYTRIEYFHWGQAKDASTDYKPNVESGILYTLGYAHRFESQRVRAELFGGMMRHSGYATYLAEVPDPDVIDGTTIAEYTSRAHGNASYFGGRAEYECLWDVNLDEWLPMTILTGLGTRAWNRSLHDYRTDGGVNLESQSQVWWTLYPYLGLEKRWNLEKGREIFASSRFGCTALTYTHYSMDYAPAFYMNPGLTAQVECGVRCQHVFLSGYFEAMTWEKSGPEHQHDDPNDRLFYMLGSRMYTTGLRLGITY